MLKRLQFNNGKLVESEVGDRPVLLTGDGEAKPGSRIALLVDAPAVDKPIEVAVEPVGLAGARGVRVPTNSVATLELPTSAPPGTYWVTARGRGLRPTARFIRVLS